MWCGGAFVAERGAEVRRFSFRGGHLSCGGAGCGGLRGLRPGEEGCLGDLRNPRRGLFSQLRWVWGPTWGLWGQAATSGGTSSSPERIASAASSRSPRLLTAASLAAAFEGVRRRGHPEPSGPSARPVRARSSSAPWRGPRCAGGRCPRGGSAPGPGVRALPPRRPGVRGSSQRATEAVARTDMDPNAWVSVGHRGRGRRSAPGHPPAVAPPCRSGIG